VTDEVPTPPSEQLYRLLAENTNDLIVLYDLQGRNVYTSPSCERLLGTLPAELSDGVHPEDLQITVDAWHRVIGGDPAFFTFRQRHADGSWRWLEATGCLITYQGTSHVMAVSRDVTDRKRAERELVESHKLLQAVVDGTSDAVYVKDLASRYLMVNGAGLRMIRRPAHEIIGRTPAEVLGEAAAKRIMERDRRVVQEGSVTYEESYDLGHGVRTFVGTENVYRDSNGNVVGFVGIVRDVTELARLEEQFRHAQKLDAVGRLAGGVAHDFNNLLMVINTYSEMMSSALDDADPNREMLTEILKAGERAATLTRQLLAFSRKQVLQARVIDLNTVVRDLAKLLERLIGETIVLAVDLDPSLGLVRVDPGLFEQAVTNLIVNARDAMPRGGTITIETRNVEVDAHDARGITPGSYVCVGVRDTGHGMDDATRARVFEPFFTTKEHGHGTGLGLAMAYGFVTQSNGHIDVDSAQGAGSLFTIFLPRVNAATDRPRAADDDLPSGTETVLLVEDEETVRHVTRMSLESLGYAVLEARDGRAAHAIASAHSGPIDLMLSDVVMPGMTGPEVAALVADVRRDMRVIFMSGYAQGTDKIDPATTAYLQKPFRLTELARKLREVLDKA
jgi:PAS domain S-box-containing protein